MTGEAPAGGQADGRTLWHGRFEDGPDPALMAISRSIHVDRRLAPDDIEGSRAHARGLARAGILEADELAAVLAALDTVAGELAALATSDTAGEPATSDTAGERATSDTAGERAGRAAAGAVTFLPADEDIHTYVERRVTELAGPAGARLHTGRSRNDQVATDLRLFCRRQLPAVAREVLALADALADRAGEAGDAYLPGYTHLQRAQPVLVVHHLLAHGWALLRDVERLLAARDRADVSPLGAGALAGSSLPLDPEATAADLGFAAVFDNSLDAVSDRDFVAEALFALSLLGVHLSRLAEELILWSSEEVGFAGLDERFSTGSSMLPQKKNPDIAELVRGKSGRLIGDLTGLLATLKGLPLAYNRDLQEDKEPLFDALDQMGLMLPALTGMVATLVLRPERMQAAADSPYLGATDLAEWLVARGVPFREAHAVVGAHVRAALEGQGALADLVAADERLGPEAAALLAPGVAVTRRRTRGGAGPAAVAEQRARFAARLDVLRAEVAAAGPDRPDPPG